MIYPRAHSQGIAPSCHYHHSDSSSCLLSYIFLNASPTLLPSFHTAFNSLYTITGEFVQNDSTTARVYTILIRKDRREYIHGKPAINWDAYPHQTMITRVNMIADFSEKGIVWGGLAITFIALVLRISARIHGFQRLWWDDAMVIFAWLMSLGNAVLWQYEKTSLYALKELGSDQVPPDADITSQVEQYIRLNIAFFVFFYTSLWSVKISFLILFRRLGQGVDRQMAIWWTVLGVVIAGYIFAIGSMDYRCYLSPLREFTGKHLSRLKLDIRSNGLLISM